VYIYVCVLIKPAPTEWAYKGSICQNIQNTEIDGKYIHISR